MPLQGMGGIGSVGWDLWGVVNGMGCGIGSVEQDQWDGMWDWISGANQWGGIGGMGFGIGSVGRMG